MRLIVTEDYETLSCAGADLVVEVLGAKPAATVLVATGETPMGMYRELAERRRRAEFEASRLRVFQLDEYLDLGPDDHRSLYRWTVRSFAEPLGVSAANVVRLPGDATNLEAACHAYEEAVRAVGGIDLAVLGLGPNGHLGFNEPPADPNLATRVVELSEESMESNGRYWGGRGQVPWRAMTAGMSVILAARRTLLVVSGAHKHDILRRMIDGPVTADLPASYLRLSPDVTVIADTAAWGDGATSDIVADSFTKVHGLYTGR